MLSTKIITSLMPPAKQISSFDILETTKSNDAKKVTAMLNELSSSNQLHLLSDLEDNDGNNFLHLTVMYYSLKEIQSFLKIIGTSIGSSLVKKVNKKGTSVFAIAINNKETIDFLTDLVGNKQLKSIFELINVDDYLQQYPEAKNNNTLLENLKLGCLAINKCREQHFESFTHSDYNLYSDQKKQKVWSKIILFRHGTNNTSITLSDYFSKLAQLHIANCGEFVSLTLFALEQVTFKKIMFEKITLSNGNHAFIVIDRKPGSDIDKPDTWGPQAVVIDAWAGEVYPSNRLIAKLKACQELCQGHVPFYNVMLDFRPEYHLLRVEEAFSIDHNTTSYMTFHSTVPQSAIAEALAVEKSQLALKNLSPSILKTTKP